MFTGVCQPLAMTKWFFSKVGNNHISHLGPISLYDFFFFTQVLAILNLLFGITR